MKSCKNLIFIVFSILLLFAPQKSDAGFWRKKVESVKTQNAIESPAQLKKHHSEVINVFQQFASPASSPATDSASSRNKVGTNVPAILSLSSALIPVAGLAVGAVIGGLWGAAVLFAITVVPAAILAIVFGIFGLTSKRKYKRSWAVAGLIVGALLLGIFISAFGLSAIYAA